MLVPYFASCVKNAEQSIGTIWYSISTMCTAGKLGLQLKQLTFMRLSAVLPLYCHSV